MKIKILQCDWGIAHRDNIRILLEDVASHIVRELREPFDEMIHVMNLSGGTPMTYFRMQEDAAHDINLTARNREWSQFAYQFGHEFCHVLSGHDRLRNNPNNWFHESLCELSSLFVLRKMATHWQAHPPYPNWTNYSIALAKYAQSVEAKYRDVVTAGTFGAWLTANENDMRQNSCLRDRNGAVALKLLPVFEQTPQGWNAVRHLPTSTGLIGDYINAWRVHAGDIDRPFIERIDRVLSGQR